MHCCSLHQGGIHMKFSDPIMAKCWNLLISSHGDEIEVTQGLKNLTFYSISELNLLLLHKEYTTDV